MTVLLSSAFMRVRVTLRCFHAGYSDAASGRKPGLDFLKQDRPDDADFFFFAEVIGTSAQTADVSPLSRHMRRRGSIQRILASLFNTIGLALLIKVGGSKV